ncbi:MULTISPECIES: BLUF domain-containing protein [Actinomycetes]|uniref:BLUF domain-containing protein n=1 Tax=Actinomycetes TaxID=1760 RepID=UPI0010A8D1FF|nr:MULTISPECIES: BLUF domain-containing protein [Actinomycetes]
MPDQALHSVVYSSTATKPFSPVDLQDLLKHSRQKNSTSNLTGMLLYRGGRFIQVLEGPEDVVRDLVETIRLDSRHTGMRILLRETLQQRNFPSWTMGYEPIGVPADTPPEGYRDTFDDLYSSDTSVTIRAVRELTTWFRHRSGRAT